VGWRATNTRRMLEGLRGSDVREIRTDAGIRLWLLSALALRRASPQSLSLAAKAFTTSPISLGAFIAKVGGRLTER
jgi:hypothetical protein